MEPDLLLQWVICSLILGVVLYGIYWAIRTFGTVREIEQDVEMIQTKQEDLIGGILNDTRRG
jgi:hypothetical protein